MIYQPQFTITAKTLNLIAFISEQLVRLSALAEQNLREQFSVTPQGTLQATPQAVAEILQKQPGLVEYCQTPRTRVELHTFCSLKDREHFRKTVLKLLIRIRLVTDDLAG